MLRQILKHTHAKCQTSLGELVVNDLQGGVGVRDAEKYREREKKNNVGVSGNIAVSCCCKAGIVTAATAV